jgi:hypothetical protein
MLSALLLKFRNIQHLLFPVLEETLELSDKHREFVRLEHFKKLYLRNSAERSLLCRSK